MSKDTAILTAAILGTKAYNEGKKRVPCLDRNLMAFFKDAVKSGFELTPLMKVWMRAWDDANLSAAI